MIRSRLRVYHGPQETCTTTTVHSSEVRPETVTVALADVLPLLADAFSADRTWLRDFADDEISISSDLYEVILAYQHYRRPVA
jgi:hypothetical protein